MLARQVELFADLLTDGLHLAWIGSGADYKEVSERSHIPQIQYTNVGGFLVFSGTNGGQPGGGSGLDYGRGLDNRSNVVSDRRSSPRPHVTLKMVDETIVFIFGLPRWDDCRCPNEPA